ncbi:MAG: ABC transporter ATP-binding protein [Clostridia bacterium]
MLRLFKYLKPYKKQIIVVLAFLFLQTLSQLYLPNLMADIVDNGIAKGDIMHIWKTGGIMIGVAVLGMLFILVATYLSSKVAMSFGRDLRLDLFSHIEDFSFHEFDKIGGSSLIIRATNDITQVQQVTMMILRVMVSAPLMAIGGILLSVSKDPRLSLILLIVIPLLSLLIVLIARKGIPLFKSMQKKLDTLNLVVRENLTGVRVIRAFNRLDYEEKRFDEANLSLTDTAIKVNKLMALLMPVLMIFMNFTTVAILWYGSIRIDTGQIRIGDLMAFIQYAMFILFSLIMLSVVFIMIPRASASAQRINEVFQLSPSVCSPSLPKEPPAEKVTLRFEDVSFHYENAREAALSGLSFEASAGQTVVVIGGTGSGKSTLVNLIPRFYDVSHGRILLNGTDIRDMEMSSLRKRLGIVSQKPVLFTGTIRENLEIGSLEINEQDIHAALEAAQANEFIFGLKDGIDTVISKDGANISGGQKQRLSIARALARKPDIYIFDDSFSALDFKTDAMLRQSLKEYTKDSVVIFVTQRVNSIMDADLVIVLEEGSLAGIGTHRTLMGSSAVYREIYNAQMG